MSRKYTHAVVIGRFQPIHEGHKHLLNKAFEVADHVIIICGSSFQARTGKNPWKVQDRERMISLAIDEPSARYTVRGVADYYDDDKWNMEVQKIVDSVAYTDFSDDPKIALVGHKKDKTSYYLDNFPQWEEVRISEMGPLDATDVRNLLFTGNVESFNKAAQTVLNPAVRRFLLNWMKTAECARVREEVEFVKDYKQQWQFAPYCKTEPRLITTDAVLIEAGHVALIRRGNHPGKGLWALPGGFLDDRDTEIEDCMIRELYEETGVDAPVRVLRGNIKKVEVFSKKGRDPRGRCVTHAHLIKLPPCPDPKHKMTPICAADDAEKGSATWVPLSQLESMREEFFLDHLHIIQKMVGGI